VQKFDAPKATLVSYIIKGILDQKLPWALVLFGVMIAVTLELAGVPSLAFAVGVYLPIAVSTPIFLGGLLRWLIDRKLKIRFRNSNLTKDEIAAEADKSPGVLLASGYIAGGAIAGTIIALLAGGFDETNHRLTKWAEASNPFFHGPWSDLLALIPFAVLCVLLHLAGRKSLTQPLGK
jgi:uncharacterized oligopeptide transporter (OPT) family protein